MVDLDSLNTAVIFFTDIQSFFVSRQMLMNKFLSMLEQLQIVYCCIIKDVEDSAQVDSCVHMHNGTSLILKPYDS